MNICRAVDLADYIIDKCNKDDMPISNLQLNKILYCIQRHFLKQGTYAFYDDIEAWCFGPVIPDVYYKYGICGVMPIRPPYPIEKVTIELKKKKKEEKDNNNILSSPSKRLSDICGMRSPA